MTKDDKGGAGRHDTVNSAGALTLKIASSTSSLETLSSECRDANFSSTPQPPSSKSPVDEILAVDVVPEPDFYRRPSQKLKFAQPRPSIRQLIEGEITRSNTRHDLEQFAEDSKRRQEEVASRQAMKFGWIEGVYVRCLQNIIGVTLFLRIAWVGAHCGLLLGTLMIVVASGVTLITALSLSAVCTNGEVKQGGLYYLISRTLGPEYGGSIGLMDAFANAVAGALYVVGTAETVRDILRDNNAKIIDADVNDVRIIAFACAVVLHIIIFVGISFESLLQKVLLIPFVVSMLAFTIGSFIGPSEGQAVQGMTGWRLETVSTNLLPRFVQGQTFFSVFSVYFPAATGIMAGTSISGDLKNPSTAIPKGTVLAIITSMFCYTWTLWIPGVSFARDADGVNAAVGNAYDLGILPCAENSTCPYGSYNHFQALTTLSVWGPLIVIGILCSTLSAALTSFVAAPKIFQAVCKDRLYPFLGIFAKSYGKDDAPRRAYIVTFVVSAIFIAVGQLNSIAPIISNFFLASYGLINYACFDASFSGAAGWRPAFKYYSKWVSLFGAAACIVIMFMMNWITALISVVVFILLYGLLKYRKPDVNWGSSMHANHYKQALSAAHRIMKESDHVKNYRPQILVLTYGHRRDLAVFAHSITRGNSLIMFATLVEKQLTSDLHIEMRAQTEAEAKWLKTEGIRCAFPFVVASPEGLAKGALTLFQSAGLGKLKPNIVLLGYKSDWIPKHGDSTPITQRLKAVTEYVDTLQVAFECDMGVAILRGAEDFTEQRRDKKLEKLRRQAVRPPPPPSKIRDLFNRFSPIKIGVVPNSPRPITPSSTAETANDIESGRAPSTIEYEPESKPDAKSRVVEETKKIEATERKVQYFVKQKRAIVDLWWLAEDGGLTLLVPYLLTLPKSFLAGAKLRVFTTGTEENQIDREREIASLLHSFRITFKQLFILTDAETTPSEETEYEFSKLISHYRGVDGGLITDEHLETYRKHTIKYLRQTELMRDKSRKSDFVVVSLPMPTKGATIAPLYLSWLEIMTNRLPPTLLVRGNQTDVLTFYS